MEEVKVVKIHGNDFILRIGTFQLDSYHPLYRFLQQTLHDAVSSIGIELLCQLLRNGRTTSGTFLSKYSALDNGTPQSNEIYSRMVVKTNIFSSYKRLNERRRQLRVIYHNTILTVVVPCSHNFAIS